MKDRTLEHLLAAYGHLAMVTPLIDIYFRSLSEAKQKLYMARCELYDVISDVARCVVSIESPDPQGDDCGTPKPRGE